MATEARSGPLTGRDSPARRRAAQQLSVSQLATRHVLRHRAAAGAQLLAVTLATAVPLTLQLAAASAADAGYRAAVGLGTRDSMVTVETVGAQSQSASDAAAAAVAAVASDAVGDRLLRSTSYARSGPLDVVSLNGKPYSIQPNRLSASDYPGLPLAAELTAGSWPAEGGDKLKAALSAEGAARAGVRVGDAICMVPSGAPFDGVPACLSVTGLWRPRPGHDRFWLSGPSSFDLTMPSRTYWQLLGLAGGVRSVTGTVFMPNPWRLSVDDAPQLAAGLRRLRAEVQQSTSSSLFTTLDTSVDAFLKRADENYFALQLASAELAVVALYALTFMTHEFLAAQSRHSLLLRVRGWPRRQLAAFLATQLALVALPAICLSIGLAAVAAFGAGWAQSVDARLTEGELASSVPAASVGVTLAIAAVSVALVAWHSRRPVAALSADISRTPGVAWWRAPGVDVGAALLAVPVLIEASVNGQARAAAGRGADLIGLALPVMGLGLLCPLGLRLLPLTGLVLRVPRRSIAARLASWGLGRAGAEHAGATVLLSLAVGLGVFAAVFESTATTNAEARAAYRTGADIRVHMAQGSGPSQLRAALEAMGNPSPAAAVLREEVQTEHGSEALVGLAADGRAFARVAWASSGTTDDLGSQLAAMAGPDPRLLLPGQPDELRVSTRASGHPATLSALVRDARGQVCVCSFGSLAFQGARELRAAVAFPSPPAYPLELVGLRVDGVGSGSPVDVSLAGLRASEGGKVTLVDALTIATGWWARDGSGLEFGPDSGALGLQVTVPAAGSVTLLPPYSDPVLPVMVAAPTMARLGLSPGMELPLRFRGHALRVRVVARAGYVPTVYPGSDDYLVMPLSRAVSSLSSSALGSVAPNELWVSGPATLQQKAARLAPTVDVDFVVTRSLQERIALSDPILVQLRADMLSGFACALVLASLGFGAHFLGATKRRLAEFAILQANGLDPVDVRRGLALEQLAVVGAALAMGVGLALAATIMLLPTLDVTGQGGVAAPPTELSVDWRYIGTGWAAAVLLTWLASWVARRAGSSVDVVRELRALS